MRLDPLDDGLENLHRATTPIYKCAIRNVGTHAGEDLVLAIQCQMIVELRDKNVDQKIGSRHAARDWAAGCWHLHHLLAAAAGFLDTGDLPLIDTAYRPPGSG